MGSADRAGTPKLLSTPIVSEYPNALKRGHGEVGEHKAGLLAQPGVGGQDLELQPGGGVPGGRDADQ